MALCERNFPRNSAFAFLEDVANEFLNRYGTQIDSVTRPYHFLDFGWQFFIAFSAMKCAFALLDSYIQQSKRKFADRNRYAMSAVSGELQDVTRMMVANIEDVINRGEALNSAFFHLYAIVCYVKQDFSSRDTLL